MMTFHQQKSKRLVFLNFVHEVLAFLAIEFERASMKLLEARNNYRAVDEMFKETFAKLFEAKEIELNAV